MQDSVSVGGDIKYSVSEGRIKTISMIFWKLVWVAHL